MAPSLTLYGWSNALPETARRAALDRAAVDLGWLTISRKLNMLNMGRSLSTKEATTADLVYVNGKRALEKEKAKAEAKVAKAAEKAAKKVAAAPKSKAAAAGKPSGAPKKKASSIVKVGPKAATKKAARTAGKGGK